MKTMMHALLDRHGVALAHAQRDSIFDGSYKRFRRETCPPRPDCSDGSGCGDVGF